jgi:hypothetical protein
MKRLKIYLDTSIISHLDASDVPDREADTKRVWEEIRKGAFEVFISPVVMAEIDDCPEPKLSYLRGQLKLIDYALLEETDEILELALKYVDAGILSKKSLNDCRHIAYSCVGNCDMLISWNFKHLVKYRTIAGVKSVNALAGYREMPIYTPSFIVGGEPENDT